MQGDDGYFTTPKPTASGTGGPVAEPPDLPSPAAAPEVPGVGEFQLPPPSPFERSEPSLLGRIARAGAVRIVLVVLFLGGGSLWRFVTSADRDDTGAITDSGTLAAAELRVGDCLDLPEADEFEDVKAKPCAEAHDAEVLHLFEMAGAAYPSDDAFMTAVGDICLDEFDRYVGRAYELSIYDLTWFVPNPDAWDAGDHEVMCLVANATDSPLVGSVKGSGR